MRIRTIAEHEATGPVKIEYDRLIEKFGMVPNVTKTFSIWPEIFQLHNELYQKIMVEQTRLPKAIKQLIAVLVARAVSCDYLLYWHTRFLTLLGMNEEIINCVRGELHQTPIDDKTMCLLEFVDRMARDSVSLTPAEVDRLREHGFSDEEVLEAAVVVGYFSFLTRIVNALGVEMERSQGPSVVGGEGES